MWIALDQEKAFQSQNDAMHFRHVVLGPTTRNNDHVNNVNGIWSTWQITQYYMPVQRWRKQIIWKTIESNAVENVYRYCTDVYKRIFLTCGYYVSTLSDNTVSSRDDPFHRM